MMTFRKHFLFLASVTPCSWFSSHLFQLFILQLLYDNTSFSLKIKCSNSFRTNSGPSSNLIIIPFSSTHRQTHTLYADDLQFISLGLSSELQTHVSNCLFKMIYKHDQSSLLAPQNIFLIWPSSTQRIPSSSILSQSITFVIYLSFIQLIYPTTDIGLFRH